MGQPHLETVHTISAAKVLIIRVIAKYFAVFFNKKDSRSEYINGNVNGNFLLKNTDSRGL